MNERFKTMVRCAVGEVKVEVGLHQETAPEPCLVWFFGVGQEDRDHRGISMDSDVCRWYCDLWGKQGEGGGELRWGGGMAWREVLREAKERKIMCMKDASFVLAINPSKTVYCCHLRMMRTGKKSIQVNCKVSIYCCAVWTANQPTNFCSNVSSNGPMYLNCTTSWGPREELILEH